jgi:hypothetical protein
VRWNVSGARLRRLDGGAPRQPTYNSSRLSSLLLPNLLHRYHCDTLGLLNILLRLPFHFLEHHRSLCYDITTIRLAYLTICCDFLAESQSLQRNIVGQGPLAACEALHYEHNRYHNHGD